MNLTDFKFPRLANDVEIAARKKATLQLVSSRDGASLKDDRASSSLGPQGLSGATPSDFSELTEELIAYLECINEVPVGGLRSRGSSSKRSSLRPKHRI